jgi:hypothetical protein
MSLDKNIIYDKDYLQTLKDLPRKERINQWLNQCHSMVITSARNGQTNVDCKFNFFLETGPDHDKKPYKKVKDDLIKNPKHGVTPDDLLKELYLLYKNCSIIYDFKNTFTIDWS